MQVQVRPKRRHWIPNLPRLSPQEAVRQGAAARHAWEAFGDRTKAMAFLNCRDSSLDGRPLDVATASDDGLAAVRKLIDDLANVKPLTAAQGQAAVHPPISPTD